MRTPKGLSQTSPTIYTCELDTCPTCQGPLTDLPYLNGRKTIQTLSGVLTIAYRPKHCMRATCPAHPVAWPAAAWQQLAPKYSTYGYDVIAQIGWERQTNRLPFTQVHARLAQHVQISEAQVRHFFHFTYLPLLACHERQHAAALQQRAASTGLLLGLDGLMPEGGEPQLWVIRELHTGWTLRCGWLDRQDETTFAAFLQPLADLNWTVRATLSDKQRGLLPALERVFPQAQHAFCQVHYLQNAAKPVAEADEQMKITLRQTVRAAVGDLLRPKTPADIGVLTVTGLVPSPVAEPVVAPAATNPPAAREAANLRDELVQDLLQRVRYLLTLKGRPPLRLAGVELFEQLHALRRCLDQLLQHQPEPRLQRLRTGLQAALDAVRAEYRDLHQAATWLQQLAEVLDPDGKPVRSGATVRTEWESLLDTIQTQSARATRMQAFAVHIVKVSASYAPGLFPSYDVAGLPRTNNGRESEFRNLRHRLLATTGQRGAVTRLLLREGAWELIPGPSSLAATVQALTHVARAELVQEQQRVQQHRRRFRLHTRSAKQSQAQLKALVRRWKAVPATDPPK